MASEARTRLSVEARRKQLLSLGRRLFANRSYDAISIDEIAAEAGISKGLLYHYFPGKRDLYLACVRDAVEDLLTHSAPDPNLPPPRRVEASIDGFVDYVADNHGAFRALLRGTGDTDPEIERILDRLHLVWVERMAEALGVPKPSPELVMSLLGYAGFINFATVGWVRGLPVERSQLRVLLVTMWRSTLAAVADIEPDPTSRERLLAAVAALKAEGPSQTTDPG